MRKWFAGMGRRVLSLVLVLSLMLSMCGTAFATEVVAEEETIHYVSLGASNTNGYGHDGYLPEAVYEDPLAASKAELNVYGYLRAPEGAYPFKVAEALESTTGKEVELHQLAISSMRVEEVLYLLDDTFEPDEYMNWRFTGGQTWFEIAEPGGIDALKQAYRDYIEDADVITIDLGWNNFGVYAFNNIKRILASDSYWKAPAADFAESMYVNETINYDTVKAMALAMLAENAGLADAALLSKLDKLADVLTYATLGACLNFDKIVEKIYDLNPDAEVVVINIQNLADDLVVDYEGIALELGDIYGDLIEMVDLYRAAGSPHADRYEFAYAGVNGDVSTFLDDLVAWDGDPATLSDDMKDCFDMYDDSLYVRSIVEYMMVGQALSGVFEAVRDTAAEYGLEIFKDDNQYTYEFALTLSVDELLNADLTSVDLTNPDTPLEEYGAAVAGHLKNLRAEDFNAYDYAFETVIDNLKSQKATVEAQKAAAESAKADLEAQLATATDETVIATLQAYIQAYADGIAEAEAGLAQLDAGINVIVPGAQAQFKAALEGIHTTYMNTLDYAYDVVATIVQHAAESNAIEISASSMSGYGSASDVLVDYARNSFLGGTQQKFYYELQKNGVQQTGVTEDPEFVMDESVLNDPAVLAAAVLSVRYDLGNSFFAHPSPEGCDQICEAVMDALANGSHATEYAAEKLIAAWNLLNKLAEEVRAAVVSRDEGKIAELESKINTLIAGIRVLVDDDTYAGVKAELEEIVAAAKELKAALKEFAAGNLYAAVEVLETLGQLNAEKAAKIKAALKEIIAAASDLANEMEASQAAIEAQIADLLNQLTALEQELNEKNAQLAASVGEMRADLENAVAVLEKLIAETKATIAVLESKQDALAAEIELLRAEIKNLESIVDVILAEGVSAGVNALQAGLNNVAERVVAMADLISEDASAAVIKAIERVKDELNNVYEDAITCSYVMDGQSYYVALGNAEAYADSAELLAQELELTDSSAILTEEGITAAELLATIENYTDDIAKADLITLGFSANTFTEFACAQLNRVMLYGEAMEMDWVSLVGEDAAAVVDEKMTELYNGFAEMGLGSNPMMGDMAVAMTMVIESYAFSYANHILVYADAIEAVQAINPDAQIVLVGMYNPLEGVILQMGDDEKNVIDVGEYLYYLVDAANAYSLYSAMTMENVLFVDAPDVETGASAGTVSAMQFVYQLIFIGTDKYNPSDSGYEYIAEQIMDTLNPSVAPVIPDTPIVPDVPDTPEVPDTPDEPDALMGDADNNGEVDFRDAMLIHQYYLERITADDLNICCCDVDGSGEIDFRDAILVHQYYLEIITEF